MLSFRKTTRAVAAVCGVAWAAAAAAQSLPSPAAPAEINRSAATRTTTTSSGGQTSAATSSAAPRSSSGIQQVSGETPSSTAGVISADHLFNSTSPQTVSQMGHRRECRQCNRQSRHCNCPRCQAAASDDGFGSWLFSSDAEAFDLSDTFWDGLELESPVDFGGWTQFGYHNKSDGVFNTKPNDFQAQQIYLYIEKVADGSEGFDWGFRGDIVYGTDGPNTQAFGNRPGKWDFDPNSPAFWSNRGAQYGWAIPQAYVEVAYDKLSVKAGHFYTLLGYQVVPATGNFFYSIPYTFNFSEAFTHTGVLAAYQASDDVTIHLGWTLGWDTAFDQQNKGNALHAGTILQLTDEMSLAYMCTAGNLGWIGRGYTHSIVLNYNITENWEYVFQSDLVAVDSPFGTTNLFTGVPQTHYDTIGINQYLFYKFTDQLKAGGRLEWWKADGTSFYEAAVGVNIQPIPNMLIRPEVRHNWCPNDALVGTPYGDQTIGAIDLILTF